MFRMKNETYDWLKKVALYILPALATLWLTLGKIWDFPYTTEIGATITAIDVFLGACLGVSSSQYYKDNHYYTGESVEDPEE